MDDRRLDPDAPLAGPPEPWAETEMPSLRDGPPWHMTEMIEAEPALAVRILERLAADGSVARLGEAVLEAARGGHPIVVVGCGTSEHAAQAVAELIREALELRVYGHDEDVKRGIAPIDPPYFLGGALGPIAVQAFEASLEWPPGAAGVVIGVSHEGGTWATIAALELARSLESTVGLITAARGSPATSKADIVLDTGELDQSWCHTVGYLSPIIAGVALQRAILGEWFFDEPIDPLPPEDVQALLSRALADDAIAATDRVAATMARLDRIVVVGGGVDRIASRELVLKIEEGTHIPAAFRDVETLLHGHLAGMDARTGIVAFAAADDQRTWEQRATRLRQLLGAAAEIDAPAAGILTAGRGFDYDAAIPAELTPAGRIVIRTDGLDVSGAEAALLATAIPLQLLTERMARVRGVNPDPIRRDDPRYLAAANAASPEA